MPLLPEDEPNERISGDDTARYGAKSHVLGHSGTGSSTGFRLGSSGDKADNGRQGSWA